MKGEKGSPDFPQAFQLPKFLSSVKEDKPDPVRPRGKPGIEGQREAIRIDWVIITRLLKNGVVG